MPGMDRTGPMGEGPRTGGGFGLCGSGADPQRAGTGRGAGRGGRPRGGGRGRCFGGGRGRFARDVATPTPDTDVEQLQQEIRTLSDELAALRREMGRGAEGE
jgi:hypothetical protein